MGHPLHADVLDKVVYHSLLLPLLDPEDVTSPHIDDERSVNTTDMQQKFINADGVGVFQGLPQLAVLGVECLQTLHVNVFDHISADTGNTRDFNDGKAYGQ